MHKRKLSFFILPRMDLPVVWFWILHSDQTEGRISWYTVTREILICRSYIYCKL